MPELSSFHGIKITMQYDDHNPPHFHATSGGYKASFNLEGDVIAGYFPMREKRLVLAWIELHRDELNDNWYKSQRHEELCKIQPL